MPASPRFLDRFEPGRVAQDVLGGSSSPSIFDSVTRAGERNLSQVQEQIKRYTYWMYVGLRPICDVFASQFPNVSVPGRAQSVASRYCVGARRQYARKQFGGAVLQHPRDDLQPVAESHPFVQLLRHVNEDDNWGELLIETCLYWHLTGEFYWWMIPNGFGLPAELAVIPTQWITPHFDRVGNETVLTKWIVRVEGRPRPLELPPEEVARQRFKSPKSKTRGYGPVEAGPFWIDNSEAIERSRWYGFRQGFNPDVILNFEADQYRDPETEVLDRVIEKFRLRNAGVDKTGEPLMVPPGVKAEAWSRTNREMDYTKSGDQVRDDVLALLGTPKTIAGIIQDVNRAAFEGSMVQFCSMKMNPLFRLFAGFLTEVAHLFDPRIMVWFDDCTPEDAEFALKQAQADFGMGARTPDEIRISRGLEPNGTPPYETGYIGTSQVPLDEDLQPPDDIGGGDDESQGTGDVDQRAVLDSFNQAVRRNGQRVETPTA